MNIQVNKNELKTLVGEYIHKLNYEEEKELFHKGFGNWDGGLSGGSFVISTSDEDGLLELWDKLRVK